MQNELFEKAPIPKAYFKMALPVVLSMVVSLIYNMVDTYFIAATVGYYGVISAQAVSGFLTAVLAVVVLVKSKIWE